MRQGVECEIVCDELDDVTDLGDKVGSNEAIDERRMRPPVGV